MFELKFLWALPINVHEKPSFNSLNAATVYYNRRTKKYFLDIFDGYQYSPSMLSEIYINFSEFIASYQNCGTITCKDICDWDSNISLVGHHLTELQFKLKILIQLSKNNLIV